MSGPPAAHFLYYRRGVAGGVAAHVDHTGQAGDMGRKHLDVHGQRGRPAAEALRPYAELVNAAENALLHFGIEGVGVALRDGAGEGTFSKERRRLDRAADADAQHYGRTRVASGAADRFHHEVLHLAQGRRGQQHFHGALVFAAEALRRAYQLYFIAFNNMIA